MDDKVAGFTLLELVVVIAIVGILAGSVVISSFSGMQKRARDAVRKSDIKTIQNALEQYFSTCGFSYPASLSTTLVCPTGSVTILDPVPKDPKTTTPYPFPTLTTDSYQLCTYNLEYETPTGFCVKNQQ